MGAKEILRVAMLMCTIGTPAICQSSPYHTPHLTTWRELQEKLGNHGYKPGDYKPSRPDDRCELPEAPRDSLMVLLSAQDGAGLPTVTLGAQAAETSTAEVKVEPGRQPLYLVITSTHPVIWRFTGAVARVRRLILAGATGLPGKDYDPTPLVGETGVPEDRVFTVRRRTCLPGFDDGHYDAAAAADFVAHQSGRKVEVQVARRLVSGFAIPSGSAIQAPGPYPSVRHILGFEKPDESLQYEINRRWPDGVVTILADRVVSPGHVEPYRVLPGSAGLQQLARTGTLTQLGADEFAVRRAFDFPAGITVGVQTRFLLDRKYGTSASCRFARNNQTGAYDSVVCD